MGLKPEFGQPVTVALLSDSPVSHPARIVRLVDADLELEADWTAPAGTPVKVEWLEYVVLGEVVSSAPGRLTIGIRHWLDLGQLSHIRKTWKTGP